MKEDINKLRWEGLKNWVKRKVREDATVLSIIRRIEEYGDTVKLMDKHMKDMDRLLEKMEELENELK